MPCSCIACSGLVCLMQYCVKVHDVCPMAAGWPAAEGSSRPAEMPGQLQEKAARTDEAAARESGTHG